MTTTRKQPNVQMSEVDATDHAIATALLRMQPGETLAISYSRGAYRAVAAENVAAAVRRVLNAQGLNSLTVRKLSGRVEVTR